MAPYSGEDGGRVGAGLVPGALYMAFNPDGIAHPDRWSYGPWLWALKYTPYAHIFSFVFGVMLANLDAMIPRASHMRLWLGIIGFGGIYAHPEPGAAGALRHHPRRAADAAVRLHHSGAGRGESAGAALGVRPLVFVGEASYCLYLLHFNLWNLIHDSHVLDMLHLSRFDPWISYALLIALAVFALHFIEKPAQRKLREWMHATNVLRGA